MEIEQQPEWHDTDDSVFFHARQQAEQFLLLCELPPARAPCGDQSRTTTTLRDEAAGPVTGSREAQADELPAEEAAASEKRTAPGSLCATLSAWGTFDRRRGSGQGEAHTAVSTPVDGRDDRCELQRRERKVEEEEGEQYGLRCVLYGIWLFC